MLVREQPDGAVPELVGGAVSVAGLEQLERHEIEPEASAFPDRRLGPVRAPLAGGDQGLARSSESLPVSTKALRATHQPPATSTSASTTAAAIHPAGAVARIPWSGASYHGRMVRL